MTQERPELREVTDLDAEIAQLAEQVLPIQRLEERCHIDFFTTRRRWAQQVLADPQAMFLEIFALVQREPGATLALLGLYPMNKAGEYAAAEAEGRQLCNTLQVVHFALESRTAFESALHGSYRDGEFTSWERKIRAAVLRGAEAAGEEQEKVMRSRQRQYWELVAGQEPHETKMAA